ncbi:MAG: PBP1A family penicillin-binding protein [Litorimonas sp.]
MSGVRIFNLNISPKFITLMKRGLIAGSLASYLGGMTVLGLFAMAAKDLPDPAALWERSRPVSVQVVDRNGRDILVRGAAKEQAVNLETLPFHVPMTVLATEDKRFYNHIGVDPLGIARAIVANIKAGRYVEGGSTLTQQLSKNIFLTPDKTIRRKAQEMMLSIWLERDYTKRELLELYLARVYFGGGAWGLEAASNLYFDKPASELTLAESAMMAGLLKGPSAYNPVANPERAKRRMAVVLGAMERQNLLGEHVKAMAMAEEITIHKPQTDHSAQYFVDWIWPFMEEFIGVPNQDIVIQTTLDIEAQSQAHSAMLSHIDAERGAAQGALISLDGTGGVIAMIGGTSYQDNQFNRAVQAQRQPGSAFKPFVYLTALRAGISPWDRRQDAQITIGDWTPKNFRKGHKGMMSVQSAFASSNNMVAVALGEEIGRKAVIQTAADFGLTGLKPYRSLALGAQVTSPLALTESYLPFANWGLRKQSYGILSISTADGTPLYDYKAPELQPVLSNRELSDMNLMMTRTVERGTGRRAAVKGHHIGGKTGTTNDFRDAWFIGYASDIVTGVWVGSDDNSPMKKVTGGTIPAQIFHDYMTEELRTHQVVRLPISPEPNWVKQNVRLNNLLDTIEGKLP